MALVFLPFCSVGSVRYFYPFAGLHASHYFVARSPKSNWHHLNIWEGACRSFMESSVVTRTTLHDPASDPGAHNSPQRPAVGAAPRTCRRGRRRRWRWAARHSQPPATASDAALCLWWSSACGSVATPTPTRLNPPSPSSHCSSEAYWLSAARRDRSRPGLCRVVLDCPPPAVRT